MHKRTLNELTLRLQLAPAEAPLLIKSGREGGADPTLLDMNFVRTTHPVSGEPVVYLPGSSLKGTIRAHWEQVARSVRPEGDPRWCCDPFDNTQACGRRLHEEENAAARYAGACAACRTFGHTRLGSHMRVSDAYPSGPVTIEQRDGVAIDRVSGAVAAGPFNLEVVSRGNFECTLALHNFQLWQVGLLAIVLRDVGEGLVALGSGKSKGFGRMRLSYLEAVASYPGQVAARRGQHDFGAYLYDLAAFQFENSASYGLWPAGDGRTAFPVGAEMVESGEYGRVAVRLAGDDVLRNWLLAQAVYWRLAAIGSEGVAA
jgi:CRISPR-associated protein Csm3